MGSKRWKEIVLTSKLQVWGRKQLSQGGQHWPLFVKYHFSPRFDQVVVQELEMCKSVRPTCTAYSNIIKCDAVVIIGMSGVLGAMGMTRALIPVPFTSTCFVRLLHSYTDAAISVG